MLEALGTTTDVVVDDDDLKEDEGVVGKKRGASHTCFRRRKVEEPIETTFDFEGLVFILPCAELRIPRGILFRAAMTRLWCCIETADANADILCVYVFVYLSSSESKNIMTTATATIGIWKKREKEKKSHVVTTHTPKKNRPWGSDQVDSVSIVSYLPSLVILRARELPRRRARFYVLSPTAR